MTIAIAFAGGTYGTYLEWCLSTLTSDSAIQSPFNSTGNSHKFLGVHLVNMAGWDRFVAIGGHDKFVRLHPKVAANESLTANLTQLCKQAEFVIHLYPTADTMLLCINNSLTKVWDNWWVQQFKTSIDSNKIYQNWPVSPDTPIDSVPYWIKREFLSFYLVPAWQDMIEWDHTALWSDPQCLTVTVKDLLFNFENTLQNLVTKLGLDLKKEIKDLLPYHKQNLELQKYLTHDQLCKNIVQSVLSDTALSWEPLSLCSESWIQWSLRNHGFEIRCNELDTFPTDSLQLKELLYPI